MVSNKGAGSPAAGPGARGLGSSPIQAEIFLVFGPGFLGPILEERDVVILDQRGTRHTVPHLDCPHFHALPWIRDSQGLSVEAGIGLERWILERCIRDFLGKGVDLSSFNSVAIAAGYLAFQGGFLKTSASSRLPVV